MTHKGETRPRMGSADRARECRFAGSERHRDPSGSSSKKQVHDRARRRILVARLHALGPAPLAHFIAVLERGADLRETLEIYAALPADFVKPYGGDRFAPALHAIGGEP